MVIHLVEQLFDLSVATKKGRSCQFFILGKAVVTIQMQHSFLAIFFLELPKRFYGSTVHVRSAFYDDKVSTHARTDVVSFIILVGSGMKNYMEAGVACFSFACNW